MTCLPQTWLRNIYCQNHVDPGWRRVIGSLRVSHRKTRWINADGVVYGIAERLDGMAQLPPPPVLLGGRAPRERGACERRASVGPAHPQRTDTPAGGGARREALRAIGPPPDPDGCWQNRLSLRRRDLHPRGGSDGQPQGSSLDEAAATEGRRGGRPAEATGTETARA